MAMSDVGGRSGWPMNGRSGRKEFWLSVGVLMALNVALSLVLDPVLTSLISLPVWIFIATRRLHDFERSGWWSLIPFGVGFVMGFASGFGVPIPPAVVQLVNLAVMLAMVVIVGSIPGTPGANLFGEPSLRRS
jgi:uncharacterized membrane protein YhaH (DUF805 family)